MRKMYTTNEFKRGGKVVESFEHREMLLTKLLERAKDDESWEPDPAIRAQLTQMFGMFLLTYTG